VYRYEYDAEGNLIRKTCNDDELWQYRWGADGMLNAVVRPDGTQVTFAYDALGRRVSKSYLGQTTRWVWDGNVPLHEWVEGDLLPVAMGPRPRWMDNQTQRREAELGVHLQRGPPQRGSQQQPITWVFEPESFTPMAKLSGDEQLSIVTDHLGVPIAMLDAQGVEVWSAQLGTWGELRPGTSGMAQDCPFRWPGQYEDAETGLYYNRFRYYDAESGQYVSQDPIGLLGGIQPHSYVQDCLAWSDPLGCAANSFTSLLFQTENTLDFSTTKDGAVFWSGPNMRIAQKWAQSEGKTTLEQTSGGRFLDSLELFEPGSGLSPTEAASVWDAASIRFAHGASGQVNVFATRAKRRGPFGERTWWRLEKPILNKNTAVTEIVRRRIDGKACK